MSRLTFTTKELEEVLEKVQNIDRDFPDLPARFRPRYQEFYSKETFPIVIKKVGSCENVNVSFKEFINGNEAGPMSIILQVGFGSGARYFQKDGYYDSWDNGNDDYQWDGAFYEVVSQKIERTEWVNKS